jgi:sodium-dependent dicarboxylate transporter 2/3/5
MLIEPMAPTDWPDVRRIYAEGISTGDATFERDAPDQAHFDRSHRPDCRFVARDGDGAIQGWVALTSYSARTVYSGVAWVSVYVSETARGRGVGTALLERLNEAAEAAGVWTLMAGVLSENAASLALHERAGFRRVGVQEAMGQDRTGRWRDVVLLERRTPRSPAAAPAAAGPAAGTTPAPAAAPAAAAPAPADEMAGLLGESAAQATGANRRNRFGFFLGPLLFLVLLVAPLGLTGPQQTLAAILALVVVFWVTEAIPVPATALLALALCSFLGVAPAGEVFSAFASSTIFLFIGSFILARAMTTHGLDRRFALRVLSIGGVAGSTYGTLIAFGLVAALMSAFISNTAATAMLLPIGLGIVGIYGGLIGSGGSDAPAGTPRLGAALMLMIAYSASVGGLLTPIGSPPNLLGRGFLETQAGVTIPFLQWTLIAAPIVAAMFAALCVILIGLNRPEARSIPGAAAFINAQRAGLGRFSAGERNTLAAFLLAVALWLLPGVVAIVSGETSAAYEAVRGRLDEGVVAILAASLLFVMPLDRTRRTFTLTWRQAVAIDWGTIVLFGAGIALGSLLSSTGLAAGIGDALAGSLGDATPLTLTFLAVIAAIVISETTSNTASVGIVVPIVISLAGAAGIAPVVPALAAIFGASFGFMLPVSTPPNAIVYGSGLVPITRMIRSGFVFDILGALIITLGVTVMAGVSGLG